MRPYQYCSKDECIERQGLGQVSELEATLETCRLPQAERVLDPRIAVTKYRRSAAGGNGGWSVRGREELQETLSHLTQICASLQATPDHPRVQNMDTVVGFVVDRLRACQSDATRLLSNPETCAPSSWHARAIRILIWLRYACCGSTMENTNDPSTNATVRTIDHMRSTAYDAYWGTVDPQSGFVGIDSIHCNDDEMLCYDAISRICAVINYSTTHLATSLDTSWNGMLLEFQKRRQPKSRYPLWNLALGIASHARREEYYVLWKPDHPLLKELPMLAKSILSGEILLISRYRTVQHYNKSFGKGEAVSDMNRLLGITDGWSMEYANVFGVPAEEAKSNDMNFATNANQPQITMKLKQVAMPDLNASKVDAKTAWRIRKSDRRWIFGDSFDDASGNPLGISPESICGLLEFGCGSVIGQKHIGSKSSSSSITNNVRCKEATTSLSRALAATDGSNGFSKSSPRSKNNTRPRIRASPLQTAIDRVKEKERKKKICRFHLTSKGCRFGDKCRFEHTTT